MGILKRMISAGVEATDPHVLNFHVLASSASMMSSTVCLFLLLLAVDVSPYRLIKRMKLKAQSCAEAHADCSRHYDAPPTERHTKKLTHMERIVFELSVYPSRPSLWEFYAWGDQNEVSELELNTDITELIV